MREAPPLERWLLALTVLGFLAPNAMLLVYVIGEGADVSAYLGDWFGTLPAAQLAVDLLVCSAAFLVWAAVDGRRHGLRWWLVVPATFLVGLCFAIPLYLLLRERAQRVGTTGSWKSEAPAPAR